jgi:hypothetical protein
MYLGEPAISNLSNFITGYMIALNNHGIDDPYFDADGFIDWFCSKYKIGFLSLWKTPFLEEAQNDEKEALMLYFKYLEEYQNERNTDY